MNIQIHHTIKDIKPEQWNSLQRGDFPFSSYEFLAALESSGSIGERTGWYPLYITLTEKNVLEAAVFIYIKTNNGIFCC